MDDMEAKMGAILGNPEAMQKIMSLAQSLNLADKDDGEKAHPESEPTESKQQNSGFQNLDLSIIQKLSGAIGNGKIDKNEQTLLIALRPYLSQNRLKKLERAMQAAKMAKVASSFLGSAAVNSGTGR